MITTDSKVEDLLDRLQEEKHQSDTPKKVQKVIKALGISVLTVTK